MDIKKAIKLYLKETRSTHMELQDSTILKNVAYNQALKNTLIFIENLENGDIQNEYLIGLDRKHNKK